MKPFKPFARRALCLLVAVIASLGTIAKPQAGNAGASTERQAEALVRLGDYYRNAEGKAHDPSAALRYYEDAASTGSTLGKLRLAEALIDGAGAARDAQKGLALIREEMANGSASAAVLLGDVLSQGRAGPISVPEALAAYNAAADQGRTRALLRLGDLYRYGILVRRSRTRALAYYRKASESGDPFAQYVLGRAVVEGEFGRLLSRRRGVALLKNAEREGVEEASVALLMLDIGRGGRRARRAQEALEASAHSGNEAAARRLIEIHREGVRKNGRLVVRKKLRRAQAAYNRIKDHLSPDEMRQEAFLLKAAATRRSRYGSIYQQFRDMPAETRVSISRRLARDQRNVYTFLLQKRLAELGYFRGRANGRMTRRTIRAFKTYCRAKNANVVCRHGPMSEPGIYIGSLSFL